MLSCGSSSAWCQRQDNGENEENEFKSGSRIDWPWKQREDSKRTSWWAALQESLEEVWEAANV